MPAWLLAEPLPGNAASVSVSVKLAASEPPAGSRFNVGANSSWRTAVVNAASEPVSCQLPPEPVKPDASSDAAVKAPLAALSSVTCSVRLTVGTSGSDRVTPANGRSVAVSGIGWLATAPEITATSLTAVPVMDLEPVTAGATPSLTLVAMVKLPLKLAVGVKVTPARSVLTSAMAPVALHTPVEGV